VLVAALLVVVIAFAARAITVNDEATSASLQSPLVSPVAGSAGPTIISTPGRIQPSEEEWAALLPQLQEIADAHPGDVNAQRKLALAYYNLGRFDQAATIYKRLLVEEDPVLRTRLGNTLRDMGDTQGAAAAYRKAIVDDPGLAPPYVDLAELLWRQGRDKEAMEIIDQGLAAVPEKSRAVLEKARETLEAAIQ
jgi:tetratricopeptide (TPR) repeat protein